MRSRFLIVGFGAAVFGGLLATALQPAGAQLAARRLSVTPVTADTKLIPGRFMFIRDAQSGGCWLAVANASGDASIAAAPDQACQGK
jgi:hypothetical protein